MQRLVIAGFLLFYAIFAALLPVVHTSVWANDLAAGSTSHTPVMRAHSPHSSHTRFIEHPFVITRVFAESPLIEAKPDVGAPSSDQIAGSIPQRTLLRSPPSTT